MKSAFLTGIIVMLGLFCLAQSPPDLPRAELLKTATKREMHKLQDDSLAGFKKSLYESIEAHLKKTSGRVFFQFSICVKTNKVGDIDTVLVSENASNALKYHILKNQFNLDYKELIRRVQAKKWFETYILFPVNALYEDSEPVNFGTLRDISMDLPHTFSFESVDFVSGTNKIIIATPMSLLFGKVVR